MEKIADKLDCVFVYGFAPRSTLENTVRKQADCIARERMNKISHHMYLEAQELTNHHSNEAFEIMMRQQVGLSLMHILRMSLLSVFKWKW